MAIESNMFTHRSPLIKSLQDLHYKLEIDVQLLLLDFDLRKLSESNKKGITIDELRILLKWYNDKDTLKNEGFEINVKDCDMGYIITTTIQQKLVALTNRS